MVNALENFFNWQMDMDWAWGPLLYLRPPRTVRMTLTFWLKLFGMTVVLTAPFSVALAFWLLWYDYDTAKHHTAKAAPVAATEAWMNAAAPATVLYYALGAAALIILLCILTQWAWNRRVDRLNREASVPLAVPAALPGVWPPPPTRN